MYRDISEFKVSDKTFEDEMFENTGQEVIAIDLIQRQFFYFKVFRKTKISRTFTLVPKYSGDIAFQKANYSYKDENRLQQG